MRAVYVDSSVVVAIEFGEATAGSVAELLDSFDRLVASNLLEAEVLAACGREGVAVGASALEELTWVLPDRPLADELRRVFASGPLKGADAWHIACALFLDPSARDLGFVTLDERQSEATRAVGFTVLPAPSRRRAPRGVR